MTAFDLALRFVGEIKELPGEQEHPFIQWGHMLCGMGCDQPDSVPWCSSFVNAVAWMLRLPRSKSPRARSWLLVGQAVDLEHDARVGNDIVVLKRDAGTGQGQPGPDVIDAPGHVGLYGGKDGTNYVLVLGGNQSNGVSLQRFKISDVLGVRRLS